MSAQLKQKLTCHQRSLWLWFLHEAHKCHFCAQSTEQSDWRKACVISEKINIQFNIWENNNLKFKANGCLLVYIHCINKPSACVIWCSRIAELTEQLQSSEDKGRAEREVLVDHLRELTTESTAVKLENQSLKVTQPSTYSCNSPHRRNTFVKYLYLIKCIFII